MARDKVHCARCKKPLSPADDWYFPLDIGDDYCGTRAEDEKDNENILQICRPCWRELLRFLNLYEVAKEMHKSDDWLNL